MHCYFCHRMSTHIVALSAQELKPYVIEKKGKPKAWDPRLTQLVVEMLANRTPPTCIGPNILATAQLLCPNSIKIIEILWNYST